MRRGLLPAFLRVRLVEQGYLRLSALVEERLHQSGPSWWCAAEVLRVVDNYLRSGLRFVYLQAMLAQRDASGTGLKD